METLKSDDPERIVPLFLSADTMKYQDIIGVAVRTLIRCVDGHMYIGKAYLKDGIELKDAAVQEVEGEGGYVAGFMEQYGGLLKTASIFGQEDFKKVDIDALDAAGEFLNCVNGLHASALSKNGLILELLPPNLVTDKTELSGNVCVMPLYIKGMSMAFIVKE
jgi:CheY-specific phosphatase CheX